MKHRKTGALLFSSAEYPCTWKPGHFCRIPLHLVLLR